MEEVQLFIDKLEKEFEEVEKGTLSTSTDYRDIKGWSSMQALILIALVDSEYGVMLNGEDLANASTIGDIYKIIQSRKVKISGSH